MKYFIDIEGYGHPALKVVKTARGSIRKLGIKSIVGASKITLDELLIVDPVVIECLAEYVPDGIGSTVIIK